MSNTLLCFICGTLWFILSDTSQLSKGYTRSGIAIVMGAFFYIAGVVLWVAA